MLRLHKITPTCGLLLLTSQFLRHSIIFCHIPKKNVQLLQVNILLRVIGHINVLDLNLQSIRLCEHHRHRHQNHKHKQNNISLCHFKNNKTQKKRSRKDSFHHNHGWCGCCCTFFAGMTTTWRFLEILLLRGTHPPRTATTRKHFKCKESLNHPKTASAAWFKMSYA